MVVAGVVAEYNPFHNGHAYQLAETKRRLNADAIVVIMSGHFTQRGEPALVDKWARASMALHGGADLVIELPFICATSSAELFALGAVQILHETGVVTHLSFGCETPDKELIRQIAQVLANETPNFKKLLIEMTTSGIPYASAITNAVSRELNNPKVSRVLDSPNTILAVQYVRALIELQSEIDFLPIQRVGSGYHELIQQTDSKEETIRHASATGIRNLLGQHSNTGHNLDNISPYAPETTIKILKKCVEEKGNLIDWTQMESTLLSILRQIEDIKCRDIPTNESEGLIERLPTAIYTSTCISELTSALKTKRHHYSRITRLMAHILVGLTKRKSDEIKAARLWRYVRILGMTSAGRSILSQMRKKATIPIITKLDSRAKYMEVWPSLRLDTAATDVYTAHHIDITARKAGLDYQTPPVMID